MKHIPFMVLLALVSCGKKTYTKHIENPYNDSNLKDRVSELENKVAALETSRDNMLSSIAGLDGQLDSSIALITSQLLTLQNNVNIVQIVDPCGDTPNKYDEVLFKTSAGQYVGSFSDNAAGLNTRFSVLPIGSYVTTDGTGCHFQVTTGGIVW
jgi:hypothetical protein